MQHTVKITLHLLIRDVIMRMAFNKTRKTGTREFYFTCTLLKRGFSHKRAKTNQMQKELLKKISSQKPSVTWFQISVTSFNFLPGKQQFTDVDMVFNRKIPLSSFLHHLLYRQPNEYNHFFPRVLLQYRQLVI